MESSKFPLQSDCNERGRKSKTCLPWMKATLTSRLQHWVIRPRSFHRWDGRLACQSISQSRAISPYPGQGKWKTYQANATCQKRINRISDLIVLRRIIGKIETVKYPKAGDDALTQNLRPAANIFTGGPYLTWGGRLPSTRRKLAMKSCRLPSYCSTKGSGFASPDSVLFRLCLVFKKLGT